MTELTRRDYVPDPAVVTEQLIEDLADDEHGRVDAIATLKPLTARL